MAPLTAENKEYGNNLRSGTRIAFFDDSSASVRRQFDDSLTTGIPGVPFLPLIETRLSEFLLRRIQSLVAVPPLLMGEDLSNEYNREFGEPAQIIEEIVSDFGRAYFLDIRTPAATRLCPFRIIRATPSGLQHSPGLPLQVFSIARP